MKQVNSTAAPFIEGVRAEKMRRAVYADIPFREYVFAWSARVAWGAGWGGGAFLVLVFLALGYGAGEVLALALAGGVSVYGVTLVWALRVRADWYDELNRSEEITFAQQRPQEVHRGRDPQRVDFDLNNGMGGVILYQPAPGAFARWLREVVYSEKQFSQAQALERGWTADEHKQLVQQLRAVGLLHATDTRRNAPVMTQHGIELAKQWLAMGVVG